MQFHPIMARIYRTGICRLIRGLLEQDGAEETKEALRALVDRIVLVPVEAEGGGTKLAIDLHGALAGLLCLATGRLLRKAPVSGHAEAPAGAGDGRFDIVE